MKARGFTLIELVIVLVLIGISAIFSTRFIADMAAGYVGTAERGQALAGARFTMERLRRELAVAYGPSVYITNIVDDEHCIYFVPALAAGTYLGSVKTGAATFVVPLSLQGESIKNNIMAIRADSGAVWSSYPEALPAEIYKLEKEPTSTSFTFSNVFNDPDDVNFSREGYGQRYTLLTPEQVRYCLRNGGLEREIKTLDKDWRKSSLMMTGITGDKVFMGYDESNQLIQLELVLNTRDGDLVLPGQLQVTYAP
ncbi:type II secretion system protein [uncultured Oceanisphaera sp.]|uniref:PulJ/GspJ family protein n=1 Tax=uncultured Oceanisphaera sp. TaxID=353858 RepID=UPI0026076C9C|nr:type II secretion system protein [uncultured Oceanisphaera sp.]